ESDAMASGVCPISRRRMRPGLTAIAVSLSLSSVGCQSLNHTVASWRSSYDTSGIAKGITDDEKQQTREFLTRWFRMSPKSSAELDKNPSTMVIGSDGWKPMAKPKANPEAEAELKAAHDLYKQDKLTEAEKAFAKIAKNRKGSPWGEKAQFFLAETQFL